MSNQSNTLLGLITGIAIGGLAGLLLAPKSGKETREDLSAKAKELADQASETKNNLAAKLSEVSAQEQDRIKGYIAQLDAYIKDLLSSESIAEAIEEEVKNKKA